VNFLRSYRLKSSIASLIIKKFGKWVPRAALAHEWETTRAVSIAVNLSITAPGNCLIRCNECNVLSVLTITASQLTIRDRIMFARSHTLPWGVILAVPMFKELERLATLLGVTLELFNCQ
jgi:hypothetical protein